MQKRNDSPLAKPGSKPDNTPIDTLEQLSEQTGLTTTALMSVPYTC